VALHKRHYERLTAAEKKQLQAILELTMRVQNACFGHSPIGVDRRSRDCAAAIDPIPYPCCHP